jgi:hypothetical protein
MRLTTPLLKTLLAVCLLTVGLSAPAWALTPPVMTITDNFGDSVTIDSTGTITFSGACTQFTCYSNNGGQVVSPGSITWSGVLHGTSGIIFSNFQGLSKPALQSPQISLGGRIDNATGQSASVIIEWSDTGFTPGESPASMTASASTAPLNSGDAGNGTVTNVSFNAYVDSTNTLNGQQTPVNNILFPSVGSATQTLTATGPGPSGDPFSMTEIVSFTMSGAPGTPLQVSYFFNKFSLQGSPYPPLTLSCPVASGQAGYPYSAFLNASGGNPPYTFSIINGSLPPGLSLDPASGAITGIPPTAGNYPFTAQVMDSSGTTANTATSSCGITITPPPAPPALSCSAAVGVLSSPYGSSLVATGGTPPYTFSIIGGSLPGGLFLNSSSGAITGTPTAAGPSNFTAEVVDSSGNTDSSTVTTACSINVYPSVTSSCVTINAIQGVPITPVTMSASGGVGGPYTFTATGLPAGLSISTNGTISGTPQVTGTFNYTVTITDSAGNKGTVNCSLTVYPPVTASCVSITAIQGIPITPVTMTGSGGAGGPYTFSATGLPAGLSIAANGTISGTPMVSGIFNYTVTITDSVGHKGTVNCSLTVFPPVVSSCVTINATQNIAITPVTLTGSGGAGGPYTFAATGLPAGLSLSSSGVLSGTPQVSGTFSYTVTITDAASNVGTFNCSVTISTGLPPCSANLGPLSYNVNEQGSKVAGEIVWFNSHLTKLGGTIPTSDFSVYVQNGTITFGPSTLTVPNAVITFTAGASCASTTFNTVSNTWLTTIPLSAAGKADEIFAAGLAYQLPATFAQNVNNVSWSATIYSSAPGLQVSWQYGASNWLTQHNGASFPLLSSGSSDYNGMMINPAHNAPLCNPSYNSGDHAGAPEFSGRQNVLTGGGSGGGGSNWTGSWSSTPPMVVFVCSNR